MLLTQLELLDELLQRYRGELGKDLTGYCNPEASTRNA